MDFLVAPSPHQFFFFVPLKLKHNHKKNKKILVFKKKVKLGGGIEVPYKIAASYCLSI
jgi:hypothetical protein